MLITRIPTGSMAVKPGKAGSTPSEVRPISPKESEPPFVPSAYLATIARGAESIR
jgi:hypothetical protein